MLRLYGEYDVIVAGAGISGVVAAVSARREGARTLLVERTGFVGGLVTAGRMTKPTGPVDSGVFREMLERAAALGGADTTIREAPWGPYSGIFDPEVLQRVMLDTLSEAGVELLLHAQVTDVVADERVRGVEAVVKSGRRLILSKATVDATGDGDVAALAGAPFSLGRPKDGKTQPITTYLRLINVDMPRLAAYVREHPQDFPDVVFPENSGKTNADYVFTFFATGFLGLIKQAKEAGDWRIPKNNITIKTGMLPGELNINATRFQGNALDERTLSEGEVELRRQAYNAFDFFRKYVPGCEEAALLDIGPLIGVRETRRIAGDYTLTYDEVKSQSRFRDAVGLSRCALDIHEPGGEGLIMTTVGKGYGLPYRALLPKGVEGLLVAGRCISVDEIALGSTRNVPACAITGEAAGTAAALAAKANTTPRRLNVEEVQAVLAKRAIALGNS
ncbi:MAG: FAD-dependent oxidoreductase [Dehalococcoidales bacterium]|nr:FAD-dependent oxidoreductase [Dehalococcoidales bacterium]